MPPVGAYGDYGLGDNAAVGGGGVAAGGRDDEDLYGDEYGDAYGGGYGDPYGATPLGDLDGTAPPSPSTAAASPSPAATRVGEHATPNLVARLHHDGTPSAAERTAQPSVSSDV